MNASKWQTHYNETTKRYNTLVRNNAFAPKAFKANSEAYIQSVEQYLALLEIRMMKEVCK